MSKKNVVSFEFFIFSFFSLLLLIPIFFMVENIVGLDNNIELNWSNSIPLENYTSKKIFEEIGGIIFFYLFFSFLSSTSKIIKFKEFIGILLIVIIGAFSYVTFNNKDYSLLAMTKRYENIIENNKYYLNTENAEKLRIAIKDNKPKDFIEVLSEKNKNSNYSVYDNSLYLLRDVVLNISPEYKDEFKSYIKDEFLSIKEYKLLKYKIFNSLKGKDLEVDQILLVKKFKEDKIRGL